MITICYTLTDDALDREYIATGKQGPKTRRLVIEDATLIPEERATLVEARKVGLVSFGPIDLAHYTLKPTSSIIGDKYYDKTPILFEAEPSVGKIFTTIRAMIGEKIAINAAIPALEAEFKAKRAREMAESLAALARLKAETARRIAAAEQARIARTVIPWDGDKALVDLKDALYAAADLEIDDRFNHWAREVTGINPDSTNGFTFHGDFVDRGTQELVGRDQQHVYLVAATTGSRRNQATDYRVIVLRDGVLVDTGIATDDDKPGWALRIRDQVAALLK